MPVSVGSSSGMLTPATRASSTSAPSTIIPNAFSTALCGPPFVKRMPLVSEITTGDTDCGVYTMGAPSRVRGTAPATPAAAAVFTKSRRFICGIPAMGWRAARHRP